MEIKDYVLKRKEALKNAILSRPKVPTLAIIVVGNNAASDSYVRGKMKDAAEVGFKAIDTHLSESTSEADLVALIQKYNADPTIDGILVQLPVPKQISEKAIHEAVLPSKDVDGFSPLSPFECCTPKGICDYLSEEGFLFRGKNAVVIGRSNIVGKPMAKMLIARDCNVTVLHSKTSDEDKRFYLEHADLVVVAIGRLGAIDATYKFKPSCWIVDVGINRGEDGHLHEKDLKERCAYLNSLHLKSLHYTSSNGTDLTVGLIPNVIFLGGGESTIAGVFYQPNIPSEECFTSPMRGQAEGVVYASKPLAYQGQLIDNFSVRFHEGKAVEVKAEKGLAALESILTLDEGSAYLGECALVPFDSPINQTGLLFYNTLYDENACCHLALGRGFTNLYPNFEKYSEEQLHGFGINKSLSHVDFMIGTADLEIVGTCADGKEVVLFHNGTWAF
jgi:5,10-methylene-tetrahydrofolate dehydrogenase/Methenyl tetrahydrofolate cyclohydrolase